MNLELVCFLIFILLFVVIYLNNLVKGYRILTKDVKKNKKRKSKKAKKEKKEITIIEIKYLVSKFSLDENKLLNREILAVVSVMDAFILSLVFYVLMKIDTYLVLKLILGFVLLLGLIYSLQELLGRFLEKRGYKK